MKLKYSIYYKANLDRLLIELVELIPKKKIHKLKFHDKKGMDMAIKFLNYISINSANDEEKEQYLRIPILMDLYKYLSKNSLLQQNYTEKDIDIIYLRQIEFFDDWLRGAETGLKVQKKLKNKRVWIIGAGGFGVAMSNLMVAVGIGSLVVFDHDKVEESNLLRQFLYTREDVGKPKVLILKKFLEKRRISKIIAIEEKFRKESVEKFLYLYKPDIVVGLDYSFLNNKILENVVLEILRFGIPVIFASEQSAGPIVFCKEDLEYIKEKLTEGFYIMKEWIFTNGQRREFHPSYAPFLSITSGLLCDQIVRFFTEYSELKIYKTIYSLNPINGVVTNFKL